MINIEKDKDLTPYTTFGIPAKAAYFAEYRDVRELTAICRSEVYRENVTMHIGGGSNLLFLHDFNGLILHSAIKGITVYDKNPERAFVIAGAGEKWTDLVEYCVSHGIAGLENMAGIPGEVGASPVQNVGAYGVEAKDVIHKVECFDRETLRVVTFSNEECGFAYRDSNFKSVWKNRYYVLRVSFRLRRSVFASNLEYGSLKELKERCTSRRVTIREVSRFVCSVRDSKLPDPTAVGSAGSFFKNPVVREKYYEMEMLNLDPSIPCYRLPEEGSEGKDPAHHGAAEEGAERTSGPGYGGKTRYVKIPAGWMIEHAGLKGKQVGGAEVYPPNCLVLANAGGATAEDVVNLSKLVAREVNSRYHVYLEPEVNMIDTRVKVTVLGSGTSKGVPELMCDCGVCSSENPLDHRLRASVLVETMGVTLLIDASPDFREQAFKGDIRHLDGVLLTHEHYDHVGGIDDLRPYCMNSSLKMYMKHDVAEHLRCRLDYCFGDRRYPGVPTFEITEVDADHSFAVKGVEIMPVGVMHGRLPILGYRIGRFAYVTDAKHIDDSEKEKLRNLDVLIVNALRAREHFAHFTVQEALDLIEEVKPKRAYLTHLCHEVGHHHAFDATLPPNVSPAYDGMRIEIE